MILINLLVLIIFLFTAFTASYSLLFSVAGCFARKKKFIANDNYKKIAVLIPCYKDDEIILQTAEHALFQKYPSHRYDVVVIADSLQPETIGKLKNLPIKLIEINFDNSTKSKALNKALSTISDHFDIGVILNHDNIMRPDFLTKINAAFVNGCYAIQAHRMAKSMDTNFSILGGISEEISNHIFRKGQQVLGFSSSVVGSGMAFSYPYLKQLMTEINVDGGFDKELELKLIEDNHRIVYLEDAEVLDEKIKQPAVLTIQRTRWMSSQLVYLKKHFARGILSFLFGKFDYANKVLHYALVPKILMLGFLLFACLLSYFTPEIFILGFKHWLALTLMYYTAILLAIPRKYYGLKTLQAFTALPTGFMIMVKAVLSIKKGNKKYTAPSYSTQFEKN